MAAHRPGETVEYLRSGGEVVGPEELMVIGPVAGRRFLQVVSLGLLAGRRRRSGLGGWCRIWGEAFVAGVSGGWTKAARDKER